MQEIWIFGGDSKERGEFFTKQKFAGPFDPTWN
jgi:hypothetical protein